MGGHFFSLIIIIKAFINIHDKIAADVVVSKIKTKNSLRIKVVKKLQLHDTIKNNKLEKNYLVNTNRLRSIKFRGHFLDRLKFSNELFFLISLSSLFQSIVLMYWMDLLTISLTISVLGVGRSL